MQHIQSRFNNRLSEFYSRMSDTTQTAATLVNIPTPKNAATLRSSLVETLRSVDQLHETLVARSNGSDS